MAKKTQVKLKSCSGELGNTRDGRWQDMAEVDGCGGGHRYRGSGLNNAFATPQQLVSTPLNNKKCLLERDGYGERRTTVHSTAFLCKVS
jgi:hypothetical protein